MKIEQAPSEFQPITITLETQKEAESFVKIMDYISRMHSWAVVGDSGKELANKLSNAFTNEDVTY